MLSTISRVGSIEHQEWWTGTRAEGLQGVDDDDCKWTSIHPGPFSGAEMRCKVSSCKLQEELNTVPKTVEINIIGIMVLESATAGWGALLEFDLQLLER